MPLIQENAPHPLSYRPDLPLGSQIRADKRTREQADLDRGVTATISGLTTALAKVKAENETLTELVGAARGSSQS